jgi:anti-sigma-K factor RskA
VKKPTTIMDSRAQELLAKRALDGLDDAEAGELRTLGAADDDSFDLTAAAIALATLPAGGDDDELPAPVATRVLRSAGVFVDERPAPARPRARALAYAGWIVAAAAIVVIIVLAATRQTTIVALPPLAPPIEIAPRPPAPPAPSVARSELLAAGAGRFDWKATTDPTAAHVRGDVVWSPQDQQGYMRFVGLVPNDPSYQYQLWIFDEARDQRFPVDGGVFDVPSNGEVVVPIRAKLHVTRPVLFAITIEKPGGVVVSKRQRIVVTAGPS